MENWTVDELQPRIQEYKKQAAKGKSKLSLDESDSDDQSGDSDKNDTTFFEAPGKHDFGANRTAPQPILEESWVKSFVLTKYTWPVTQSGEAEEGTVRQPEHLPLDLDSDRHDSM